MTLWDYNQESYEKNKKVYEKIEGNKLVRIEQITDSVTANDNDLWQIVFGVSDTKVKIRYNLVFDKAHPDITNSKLGKIFDAFHDEDGNMIKKCVDKSERIGKIAAAKIRSKTSVNGNEYPDIHYFIDKSQADKLNLGQFIDISNKVPVFDKKPDADLIEVNEEDLPF